LLDFKTPSWNIKKKIQKDEKTDLDQKFEICLIRHTCVHGRLEDLIEKHNIDDLIEKT